MQGEQTGDSEILSALEKEMAAYARMQDELVERHLGKWVLIYDEELWGVFDDFEDVARTAVSRFGKGPFHIRQVGDSEATQMPASLMFGLPHLPGG